MLDLLIPEAYAQSSTAIQGAANAGKDAAVAGGTRGIQSLVSYVAQNIDNWIAGAVIVFVFYILSKMAAKAMKEAILKDKGEDVEESALILVERITHITVIGIGVTVALAINGLNFTAAIGALSLGIGFALKDILGNFISGVIMLSQDRIKIGDFIKVNDILGTIVSIDTRATILQAIDGTEVVIPNQTMLSETLISYSTNPFRRVELSVGVDYKTDLPTVTSLIRGIIDKDDDIVPKPEPVVLVDAFGDSSINIVVRFWVESSANWFVIRSNLNYRIKKAFDELGINIPFPIRTLKLDEDDRSFLKTMDSLKKGVVPEKAVTPSKDSVAGAARNTENAVQIPFPLFDDGAKHAANLLHPMENTNSSETKEEVKPQDTPAVTQPERELVGATVAAQAPTSNEEENSPKPPPSHL